MYIYDIKISPADKNVKLDTPEWKKAITEAQSIANQSFTALRYKRIISKLDFVDSNTVVARLESRDPINPTRAISNISFALVKNESAKQSHLLDGHIINGRVFKTSLIPKETVQSEKITILSDAAVVQEIISVFFDQKNIPRQNMDEAREVCDKIRDIIINYINKRQES